MPPLPDVRVQQRRPFAVTGVDYGGPLTVRNDGVTAKRYIALFTCAVTRAIHLEVANDMSAEGFLHVFQRFVARRSCPSVMISDNGTNFTSAAETLQFWENHPPLHRMLIQRRCKWKFIPSRAPWFGGFYERLIGMTKTSLRKALGRIIMSDEELQTIMCRVEAHLNDRPLTYVSDQPDDSLALTPSMLIQGYRYDSLPEPVLDPDEDDDPTVMDTIHLTRRQQRNQRVLQTFWTQWQKEYLLMLRQPSRGRVPKNVPEVDDIVLIHDETPRLFWQVGKIVSLQPGVDGFIRSAEVRTPTGVLRRPVIKLYPLELSAVAGDSDQPNPATPASENQQRPKPPKDPAVIPDSIPTRPLRAAAARALTKIAAQGDILRGGEDLEY